MSSQLAAIMKHPDFQRLEGSWRGLQYLVWNTETSSQLKIKVLNVAKPELARDLNERGSFETSETFKKVCEDEYLPLSGEPFGALIGDYEFSMMPEDIRLLEQISHIAAAAFCPFLTAAAPALLGLKSFCELAQPLDLEPIFNVVDYGPWRSFRESADSRFVVLTMPRVLARLPYGSSTFAVESFNFEEMQRGPFGEPILLTHEYYCWTNSSYALGARLTDAFAKYGRCTMIRGLEGGGTVEQLPCYLFSSDDGGADVNCPTEIGITERLAAELRMLGFAVLCHPKNSDSAVFFSAPTVHKPGKDDEPEASACAAIAAGLPCTMATSRFIHYLLMIAHEHMNINPWASSGDVESKLCLWIAQYVSPPESATPDVSPQYPLREARVEVREAVGEPGRYVIIVWLQPWLPFGQLTVATRAVAKIPSTSWTPLYWDRTREQESG